MPLNMYSYEHIRSTPVRGATLYVLMDTFTTAFWTFDLGFAVPLWSDLGLISLATEQNRWLNGEVCLALCIARGVRANVDTTLLVEAEIIVIACTVNDAMALALHGLAIPGWWLGGMPNYASMHGLTDHLVPVYAVLASMRCWHEAPAGTCYARGPSEIIDQGSFLLITAHWRPSVFARGDIYADTPESTVAYCSIRVERAGYGVKLWVRALISIYNMTY
ncbi:hypothetical protein M426DRAFT_13065 [Hypoxylon sp. CI-4A]|nr:hypothetical protein M426DRAFT_13065 [Hypoxylon sp. CI-4A]